LKNQSLKFSIRGPPFLKRHVTDDPDKTKGPGGLTMREVFEQVQRARARDRAADKSRNALLQKQNRWQRFVRFVWDKRKG